MTILFLIFALIAVFCAVMVVTRKSPLASAVFLIVVMCSLAGLFATLGAFFIAAMQVIVYAGAIMVLVIFVIMLLNLRKDEFGIDRKRMQRYLGLAFAALILVQAVFIIGWAMNDYSSALQADDSENTIIVKGQTYNLNEFQTAESVAYTLFTKFAYPFEVTSILLLAAIIGAMVISRKKLPGEETGEGNI
jgi:NADH-quinone oxidoreductase subunit J